MPNWVNNAVLIQGNVSRLVYLRTQLHQDDDWFCFTSLIPRPSELDIECGAQGQEGLRLLFQKSDPSIQPVIRQAWYALNPFLPELEKAESEKNITDIQEALSLGRKYLLNYCKYGHCTWYSWSYEKWGTKWPVHACEPTLENQQLIYTFSSAWEPPLPFFKKLGRLYPDLTFLGAYLDKTNNPNKIMRWRYEGNDIRLASMNYSHFVVYI